jgi:hypothetical protein
MSIPKLDLELKTEQTEIVEQIEQVENYLRDLNDVEGIKSCYEKYGVVGVTNVLTKTECAETIDDAKNILISFGCDPNINIYDQSTHDLASKFVNRFGVIGRDALFTKILNRNRDHQNVKQAYSIVYNLKENEISPQYDRIGWMRPTVSLDGSNSALKFITPSTAPGLHLDIDPVHYFEESKYKEVDNWLNSISYNTLHDFMHELNVKNIKMGRHCQGVLNLFDNLVDDGGFIFVPGGHKILKEWYNSVKYKENKFVGSAPNGRYFFNKGDAMPDTARLPCPAGTLIIFDATMPHGTKPNMSSENRMVQYLRYIPKNAFNQKTFKRRQKLIELHSKKIK